MTGEMPEQEKAEGRFYEASYLVSPNVPEDRVAEVVGRLRAIVEKQGAFIISDEYPKFRQLAYALVKRLGGKNEKYTNAYFGWLKFEGSAETVAEVEKGFKQIPELIRFLMVKAERESKFPSKPAFWHREAPRRETPKTESKTTPTMTEAEMDKTIEELVVE